MAVGTWDSIADWYAGFVAGPAAPFTERGAEALRRALGPGNGALALVRPLSSPASRRTLRP